jgi:hypothetical protein
MDEADELFIAGKHSLMRRRCGIAANGNSRRLSCLLAIRYLGRGGADKTSKTKES